MAEEVQTEQQQLSPEDQQALDRARGTTPDYTETKYNEDGSPKQEEVEIPEKFQGKSLEDVVKAYTELEKKLSEKQQPQQPNEEADKETKEDNTEDQSKSEVEDKVNETLTPDAFKKYEEAYISQGELSEEHYKELADKGLSKEIVDLYIEGAKAKGQLYSQEIYSEVGGKEAYDDLITWASENIEQTTAQRLNEDLTSGDVNRAKFAIETLQLRRGTPPRRLEGTGGADAGIKAYKSKTEWQQDVRDPNYGRDKKFTAMVDSKYLAAKKRGTL